MRTLFQSGTYKGVTYSIQAIENQFNVIVETKTKTNERIFENPENARQWVESCIDTEVSKNESDIND